MQPGRTARAGAVHVPQPSHPGRRLTVVLVVGNLEFGGAERQVVHLALHLDPARFDAHICSLSSYMPLAEGVSALAGRLHVVQKRSKYDVTVLPRLRALLRRLGADVVHGFLFDAQIAARIAGRWARVPVIVDSERNSDYQIRPLRRLCYRLTRGCVDAVIANSCAGAQFHRREHGYAAERYSVIYNGVDTERFRPRDAAAVRQELGLAPDDFVVGIFGSFKRQKNHALFFASAARLVARQPRTWLLVVGDTLVGGSRGTAENKRRVAELVARLGLQDRSLFLGNRLDPERLYPACDVVALPSLYEGTPNVLLEAMACGVPVVATAVGDNAYVVVEGTTGFLVPSGDETAFAERLAQLAADADLRVRMGAAARRRAEEAFSLQRLGEETGAVYERLWQAAARGGARTADRAPHPGTAAR